MEFVAKMNFGNLAMRMSIETLSADYYRQQALECLRLADATRAAKPLFARLYLLARACEEKAKAADSILADAHANEKWSSLNERTSPRSML
jgi:hypothetical protein